MLDEQLTRLDGSLSGIANVANSRPVWAAWPLLVGLAVGGSWRGALAGAVALEAAFVGFYGVHVGGGWARTGITAQSWFAESVVVGATAGLVGALARTALSRLVHGSRSDLEA